MATLVLHPQSILLNPSPSPSPSPRHYPLSLPSSPSLFPIALSSSSSSVEEGTYTQKKTRSSSIPGNPRRIRFAPLPISDLNSNSVFLDPEVIPQNSSPISGCSLDSLSLENTPKPIPKGKDDRCQTPTTPQPAPLPSFNSQSSSLPPSPTSTPKKSTFSKRLLKPLFYPWNKPSLNDNDTLRRVSSRESTQSARGRLNSKSIDDEFDNPLSRWESSSSISSYVSDSGRSLSRRPKSSSILPLSRNLLSYTKPTPVTQKHPSAKPGMRMLNGRIYGRRRPFAESSTNPFANVQNEEPEFVEWGYGGMGSIKANVHSGVSGRWKSIQGDGNTSAFGGGRTAAGDEDDASGMAWVKKRKEMRERQRKEEEKKGQETISKDNSGSESTVVQQRPVSTAQKDETTGGELQEEERTPKLHPGPIPSNHLSEYFPRPSSPPHDSPGHIYTAITLPPTAHKHHHNPYTYKRDLSAYRLQSPIIQTPSNEDTNGLSLFALDTNLKSIVTSDDAVEVAERKVDHVRDIRDSEEINDSTSEEEDSSVTDDDEEHEESDSDSESGDEEATRKTALGAGVEKISRHKDHQEPRTSTSTLNTPGVESVAA